LRNPHQARQGVVQWQCIHDYLAFSSGDPLNPESFAKPLDQIQKTCQRYSRSLFLLKRGDFANASPVSELLGLDSFLFRMFSHQSTISVASNKFNRSIELTWWRFFEYFKCHRGPKPSNHYLTNRISSLVIYCPVVFFPLFYSG